MMIQAVLFKEWLKMKTAFWGLVGLWILVIGYIYFDIAYQLKFFEAAIFWYNITTMGYQFYSVVYYIPLLTGLILGITQFVPEITEKRLKLTLHLPVKENKMLLIIISTGGLMLLTVFVLSLLGLIFVSNLFFAWEITYSMIISVLPWYYAGIVIYFASAMIILEPIWLRRLLYAPIILGYIYFLLEVGWFNLYQDSLITFLVLSLFFILSVLITGYRFKRGAMK